MDATAEIKRLLKESKSEELRHNRNLVYKLPSGEMFSWNQHSSYRGLLNALSVLRNMLGIQKEKKEQPRIRTHRAKRQPRRRIYIDQQTPSVNPTSFRSELRTALGLQPKVIDGFSASPHHFSTSLAPRLQEEPAPQSPVRRLEEVHVPFDRPSAPRHRALGQSSPAHVMPPEILERANRALREGGPAAFNTFMQLWRSGQLTHQEENVEVNTPKTETNNLQYLHEMIEKSKTQKKVMEGEISSAREQIVSLQAQIQQIDQSITLKKSQMDEIDNFVSAADMVLEQVAKIEPVLLRAGIVAVPVQSGNDGTKKMRPLSHQIVMSETLVLMQRKRTEEEDFKGVHLTEIHKYLEEKHGLTLDKQSIYATLTQQAKKPDSQLKYLGQATWTLKGKAGRMNGAALAHAASHRTAAIA